MYQFIFGVVIGVYLEQRYKLPNVEDKIKDIDKYIRENYKIEKKDDDK